MTPIHPVPNEEHWCRHLLTPSEVHQGENGPEVNPKTFENLLKRDRKANPPRFGVSGRLYSLARGTIRANAEATAEELRDRGFQFHGILYGRVGDLRQLAGPGLVDVLHTPREGIDEAHADLVADSALFSEHGVLTDECVEALKGRLSFLTKDSEEFNAVDRAEA